MKSVIMANGVDTGRMVSSGEEFATRTSTVPELPKALWTELLT